MRFSFLLLILITLIRLEVYAAEFEDYYQVLKIDRTASQTEIKKAYRREISLHHPDKFPALNEKEKIELDGQAQLINAAYEVLADPIKKKNYDQTLKPQISEPNPITPVDAANKDLHDFSSVFTIRKDLSQTNRILVALSFLEKRFPFDDSILANLPRINSYLLFTESLWSEHLFQLAHHDIEIMEVMIKTSFAHLKKIESVHKATYQKSFDEGYRFLYTAYLSFQKVKNPNSQNFQNMLSRALKFIASTQKPGWSAHSYKVSLRQQHMMCKEMF